MTETISDEESFEYSLRNFLQWLEVVMMEPVELCNTWGNYNVAWELISDLNADGNVVLKAGCSYLSEEQKREVSAFLDNLNNIPKSLLVSATTISANQDAMSHPCWVPYRKTAWMLLQVLESAAARNRAYFSNL
ncbi:hypothetical protein WN982_36775 [Paraburkholderia sp. IMGN_8]|uniref:hypothetical protein n=1 Tax=Paraburkholderia sp. IMGN_8 TaxID=3136564 RepID=UPI00310120D8